MILVRMPCPTTSRAGNAGGGWGNRAPVRGVLPVTLLPGTGPVRRGAGHVSTMPREH
jgi:hypothetical protein